MPLAESPDHNPHDYNIHARARGDIGSQAGMNRILVTAVLTLLIMLGSREVLAAEAINLDSGDSQQSTGDNRWAELKATYFGDRDILAGEDVITMEAPTRAHDAATVPIVIKAVDPDRRIKQVHLIVDKNPIPMAGVFKISEEAGNWESLETRIRINEYTDVRAIAELADGTLHMTSRFIKAAGGCSAPAMADLNAALARAGKMQLRLGAVDNGGKSTAEAVIKISHPNNSGMQFDQISRNYIPAFFVHTIAAELNGKPLIDVETNFSMSENPVVRLNFSPTPDPAQQATGMLVYALDSKGNRYEKSLAVEQELSSAQ